MTMKATRAVCSFLLFAGLAAAQCPFTTFTVSGFGGSCNPVVPGVNLPIVASATVASCSMRVEPVPLLDGDLNPLLKAVVIGAAPLNLPLPEFGVGCTLVPSPDLMLVQPVLGGSFVLQVPPTVTLPLTLYAQGAILYASSSQPMSMLAFTDALMLVVQ